MDDDIYSQIFSEYQPDIEDLIPLLQRFQQEFGYLSQDHLDKISQYLKISINQIYGVASFYSQFRLSAPGRNSLRVCVGTACHVQGGSALADTVQRELGIVPGQTTEDGRFDYQEVACLGCCAQSAVVQINDEIYGKMTANQLKQKLSEYE
jgi:NADH:ubiquinone oxidoreductase subunit E